MPIRIPDALPATSALESENIFVMTEFRALHQDIRPLKVVILNLMPTKETTETQIMRKLSNTPLQIDITLLHTASHSAKNVSESHLDSFYRTFDEIRDQHFDGMIITGAPVETLHFTDVDYWDELCEIMEWSNTNVHSVFHICWGAQAGIYYHYGIAKHDLPEKMFGVFKHYLVKSTSPLVRGLDDEFWAPHSRFTEVRASDIAANPDLELIALSDEAGVYIAKSLDSKHIFVFGHPEYDRNTLKAEYDRDISRGMDIAIPKHYYPNDDPTQAPHNTWRAQAQLIYTNWLNYYVYQTTPYDVALVGKAADAPATQEEVASAKDASTDKAADAGAVARAGAPVGRIVSDRVKPARKSAYLRAENEDDDGYDPYSDRRSEPPLFEPDPWR